MACRTHHRNQPSSPPSMRNDRVLHDAAVVLSTSGSDRLDRSEGKAAPAADAHTC
jgi:hypothetical protein